MPQSNSNPLSVRNRHWGFSTAGRVFFGWGVLEELRNVRQELGERVLVCTDHNLVQAGIADRVDAWLKESGCAVHVFPMVGRKWTSLPSKRRPPPRARSSRT